MFFCVFRSMFYRFLEGRNLKNINFASTGALFLQNRLFQKNVKTSPTWAPFGEAKALENHVKSGQVRSRHFMSKKGRPQTFCSQLRRSQSEHPSYKEGSCFGVPIQFKNLVLTYLLDCLKFRTFCLHDVSELSDLV